MKEFFKNYFGYIIGILLTPLTWKVFEAFKRTFKGKNKQKCTPKNKCSGNDSKVVVINKEKQKNN